MSQTLLLNTDAQPVSFLPLSSIDWQEAIKYMVLENQLPTASFLGSHKALPFFLSSGSSFFPPFFRTYLMFLKTIHSIDLWSTCLNLLGV
jgi:hypothetical protein